MNSELIIRIAREALILVLLLSGGPMLAGMVVGFIVSLFQATTQIQEQTLSYVPKLVAVLLTLIVIAPWMLSQTVLFARSLLDSIALIR